MQVSEDLGDLVSNLNEPEPSYDQKNVEQVIAYWKLRSKDYTRIDASKNETVSKNTTRSYNAYQNAFLEFCKTRFAGTECPERVTGEKLLIYLVYRVDEGIIKKVKTRQKKAVHEEEEADENGEEYETKETNVKFPIKFSTLDTITSAIIELYERQVKTFIENVLEGQPWAHPRTSAVKRFLKAQQQMISANSGGSSLKDDNINTTYTEKNFIELIGCALAKSTQNKSYVSAICALTLFQSLLFKGDSGKSLELIDIRICMDYKRLPNQAQLLKSITKSCQRPNYGVLLTSTHIEARNNLRSGRPSTLLAFDSRKTSRGKSNFCAAVGSLRHVDVKCCSHFWLASYMVERFHVNMEEPIVFDDSKTISEVKLFTDFNSSSDRNNESNYFSQHQDIKKLMQFIGISPDNVTCAPRAAGAQVCDSAGVSPVDIGRFRMWRTGQNSSSLFGSYIYNIPVGPMAALSGAFQENGQWKYSMPRDLVIPKRKLKEQIFPFINDILEENEYLHGRNQFADNDKSTLNTSLMAITMCSALDYLRTVFIQDYKFMQESFTENVLNNNPIFKLGIFHSQEYADFRAEQDAVYAQYVKENSNPREAWEKNPEISSAIQYLSEETHKLCSSIQNFQTTVNQKLDLMENRLMVVKERMNTSNSQQSKSTSRNSRTQNRAAIKDPPRHNDMTITGTLNISTVPSFTFCKAPNFKTMWKEYFVSTPTKTCIKELEEEHGRDWRTEKKVNKMYQRRKVIYDAIERGLQKKYTEQQCLDFLEDALKSRKVNRTEFMDKNLIPDELK